MNHPIIPAYFMTAQIDVPKNVMVRYVHLTAPEYVSMLKFTRSYRCSTDRIFSRAPYPNTIVVSEYSGRRERTVCVLPADGGCQYLFGVANLRQIDWSRKDTFPLFQFEKELNCRAPLIALHGPRPSP